MDNHHDYEFCLKQFEMVQKGMGMGMGAYNLGHSKEDINGSVDLTLQLGLSTYHKNQNNNLNIISQTQLIPTLNNILPQSQPQQQQQTPYFNYIEYVSGALNFDQAIPYEAEDNMNMMSNGLDNSGGNSGGDAGVNIGHNAMMNYLQENNAYLTRSGSYNNITSFYNALEELETQLEPRQDYVPFNFICTAPSTTISPSVDGVALGGAGAGAGGGSASASGAIIGGVGSGVIASGASPSSAGPGFVAGITGDSAIARGVGSTTIDVVGACSGPSNATSPIGVGESPLTSNATRRKKMKRVLDMKERFEEDRGDNLKRCSNRNCGTDSTPMWRKGPLGPKSLCNACGIKYRKQEEKKA